MKIVGNILNIKTKRSNQHKDIKIHIDSIQYITYKKDGRYYQPFDFIATLETPLVITGDCLARIDNKYLEEGEHDFQVFDKIEDDYILNKNKTLSIMLVNDPDEDQPILTSIEYSVTVPNDEYNQINNQQLKRQPNKKSRS